MNEQLSSSASPTPEAIPHYPAFALAPGSKVGNFVIGHMIGKGGFGIVYAATQEKTGRKVAIKEYYPLQLVHRDHANTVKVLYSKDEHTFHAGLASFIKEASILADLSHPALVQVLHFWEENNTAYMAMPLYNGHSLAEWIAQGKQAVSTEFLLHLLRGILPALQYLHERNIFHRDISPNNIFLVQDQTPLLLDFGAARQIIDTQMDVSAILNTKYAPPEQYDDKGGHQGPWTDIYALASVLYELITGSLPPTATSRQLGDTLQTISIHYAAHYPANLLKAVDYGLQFLPKDRPRSVQEWSDLLFPRQSMGAELTTTPSTPVTPKLPTPYPQPDPVSAAPMSIQKWPRLVLAGGIGLLLLVLLGLFLKRSPVETVSSAAQAVAAEPLDDPLFLIHLNQEFLMHPAQRSQQFLTIQSRAQRNNTADMIRYCALTNNLLFAYLGFGKQASDGLPYCQKLAARHVALGEYLYGMALYNKENASAHNKAEGTTLLQAAAVQGDSNAQAWLSILHFTSGRTTEAVHLSQEAAQQGNPVALNNLGYFTARGLLGKADDAQACAYYQQAARLDYADAQYNLGKCHEKGRGVPVNIVQARIWYERAAQQDHQQARAALQHLVSTGSGP